MNTKASLHFITPCFCTGADRLAAEIRAASIRGELRWWFRCMGANKAEEDAIFGSIGGRGTASKVLVRVSRVTMADQTYSPTHAKLEDQGSYLHFYIDQPPKNGESRLWSRPPNRTTGEKGTARGGSCFGVGSSFVLEINAVRPIPADSRPRFDLAVEAMLRFGSIGFRHTRGFGAWHWNEKPLTSGALDDFIKKLKEQQPGFDMWIAPNAFTALNASNALERLLGQIETKLKGLRSLEDGSLKAKNITALGHVGDHGRQASAVRFRPLQVQTKKGDVQYKLVIIQAPDQVLSSKVGELKRIVPGLIPR